MTSTSNVRSSQKSHIPPPPPHHHHQPSPATSTINNNNNSTASSKSVGGQSVRSKTPSSSRRSVTPNSRSHSFDHDDLSEAGRVRVAVRLRPKNTEDLLSDADFSDCVELQPELKRLKLRKNNWSSESYRFDEVLTETASQKRVYEAVAKPVVESVLSGYNGTIMAYGQTGTGKTYTLGTVGKDDASERGIMVRALEDIIASTSPASDSVEISYLQIYMESVQDLLAPEKINMPIVEDPKNGEVSLPGAAVVKIQNLDHFIQLLQIGEANRHASNTKMNTESSRSHAILMVYFRRSIHVKEAKEENNISFQGKDAKSSDHIIPTVRKSKLLIVDLAGSERLDKSGSEGHLVEETKFINLSLSSLGKCINALAENSPHIPTRDSKLTRLLRDSFGGSARTSLIITIGPSSRHQGETTSTIMFGQRAMKVVNMVKLKEEFDYESLCRKLENQVDNLTAELDRQQKLRDTDKFELEKNLRECQHSFSETEKTLIARSELSKKENARLEMEMKDILKELDHLKDHNSQLCSEVERLEISLKNSKLLEKENFHLQSEMKDIFKELNFQKDQNTLMHGELARLEMDLEHSKQYQVENSTYQKVLAETTQMYEKKIAELMMQLDDQRAGSESSEEQLNLMNNLLSDQQRSMQQHQIEHSRYQEAIAETTQMYEEKIGRLQKQLEEEHAHFEDSKEQLVSVKKLLRDHLSSAQTGGQHEIDELGVKLQEMCKLQEASLGELQSVKSEYKDVLTEKARLKDELHAVRETLLVEEKRRKAIENELVNIKKVVPESEDEFEDKRSYMKENVARGSSTFGTPLGLHNSNQSRDTNSFQRTTIAKICEEVGLQKILALLTSGDLDVQIHAVKVVANLAAEDTNQEKIVEEGGLDALLMLLRSSQNTTILRVASGAIANLAMNEINQGLIMNKGGAHLLANTASKTDDSQTLRMVAGAIANLCGNEKLHLMLSEEGAIRALLGMVRSGNSDVVAQVARGIANFAKCESRSIIQGHRRGRSLLIDDGVLTWLLSNSSTTSASSRRHIELALCHLGQNENNSRAFITSGGAKELTRISIESNREDIRNLAKKTLKLNRTFQAEGYVE